MYPGWSQRRHWESNIKVCHFRIGCTLFKADITPGIVTRYWLLGLGWSKEVFGHTATWEYQEVVLTSNSIALKFELKASLIIKWNILKSRNQENIRILIVQSTWGGPLVMYFSILFPVGRIFFKSLKIIYKLSLSYLFCL